MLIECIKYLGARNYRFAILDPAKELTALARSVVDVAAALPFKPRSFRLDINACVNYGTVPRTEKSGQINVKCTEQRCDRLAAKDKRSFICGLTLYQCRLDTLSTRSRYRP